MEDPDAERQKCFRLSFGFFGCKEEPVDEQHLQNLLVCHMLAKHHFQSDDRFGPIYPAGIQAESGLRGNDPTLDRGRLVSPG